MESGSRRTLSLLLLQLAVSPDQSVGRAGVLQQGFLCVLEFGNDSSRQDLAQLHALSVKRVNVPDDTPCENSVLIEPYQLAKNFGSELVGENSIRWPVTFEDPVRHQPIGCTLSLHLIRRLAEGKCFGLGENIGEKYIVMPA
jgi:hypothetical protein